MQRLEAQREREELARELESETGSAMLRTIGRNTKRVFAAWSGVGEFLCSRETEDGEKDEVLRAVGVAREEFPHPLWNSVYLYLLFPGLVGLLRAKRKWGEDGEEELWQDLLAAFLESVRGFDVCRWPDRIAARLIGQTRKRLHRKCKGRWRELRAKTPFGDADLERIGGIAPGIDWAALELGEAQEEMLQDLVAARDAGVIGVADFQLLVGTCVYGRSSAEVARERGVSEEALRKRKQRARAAVIAWKDRR